MWFLLLPAVYILFYSHHKDSSTKVWVDARTYDLQQFERFNTLASPQSFLFTPPTHTNVQYLVGSPYWNSRWLEYSVSVCLCMTYVRWRMRTAIFAQFSPAGPEAVFIAVFLASVLWDVRTDGSEKRSLRLERNETDPLPDSLSWGPPSNWLVPAPTNRPPTVHPPRICFWTCPDNRISRGTVQTECPGLQCALRVGFGYK